MANETHEQVDTSGDDDISMFLVSENDDAGDGQNTVGAEDDGDQVEAEADADDEVEAASGAQDDDATAEDEADEEDDDPLIVIEMQRGNVEVPFSELKSGYLRQADYTKKTQALAEDRSALAAERDALQAKQQEVEAALTQWAISAPQEPDWPALAQQMHPQEFQIARAQYEAQQRRAAQAKEAYQQLAHEQHQERLASERDKLLSAVPEWSNPDTLRADVSEMMEFAGEYGLSPEEVAAATDHRMLMLLRDAARGRKMANSNAGMQKRVAKAAKSLPAGARSTKAERAAKSSREKLARVRDTAGSEDAFADWLIGG